MLNLNWLIYFLFDLNTWSYSRTMAFVLILFSCLLLDRRGAASSENLCVCDPSFDFPPAKSEVFLFSRATLKAKVLSLFAAMDPKTQVEDQKAENQNAKDVGGSQGIFAVHDVVDRPASLRCKDRQEGHVEDRVWKGEEEEVTLVKVRSFYRQGYGRQNSAEDMNEDIRSLIRRVISSFGNIGSGRSSPVEQKDGAFDRKVETFKDVEGTSDFGGVFNLEEEVDRREDSADERYHHALHCHKLQVFFIWIVNKVENQDEDRY